MKDLIREVGSKRLLYVMAVDMEYGEHLRSRFRPLFTGVGPVEAAVKLTAALEELRLAGSRPDLVVSLGSAGSSHLEQTTVYQVTAVSYRDMDASALGFEKGATPFLELPVTVTLPLRIPGIPEATLSTGANIVSGAAYESIAADLVDMETFAVLRSCNHFDLPLVGLRGVSDGAAELTHVNDWTEYLHVVDENLAASVDRLEGAIAEGSFAVQG